MVEQGRNSRERIFLAARRGRTGISTVKKLLEAAK
jgi:hypothetical protein